MSFIHNLITLLLLMIQLTIYWSVLLLLILKRLTSYKLKLIVSFNWGGIRPIISDCNVTDLSTICWWWSNHQWVNLILSIIGCISGSSTIRKPFLLGLVWGLNLNLIGIIWRYLYLIIIIIIKYLLGAWGGYLILQWLMLYYFEKGFCHMWVLLISSFF